MIKLEINLVKYAKQRMELKRAEGNYILLTNQKFDSFGCHGNQGANPCIMAVFVIYRRQQALLCLSLYYIDIHLW